MDKKSLADILQVFLTLQVTKELPRQGFINFGFKRADSDSVAAHSFTVCSLSYFLARALEKEGIKVNPDHTLKIALVHDMGEAISGDIGYHVKRFAGKLLDEVEEQTFAMLIAKLDFKQEITELYHEYKALETLEAKVVKCADALDAYTQMLLTPGTNMESQTNFVSEKAEELGKDEEMGERLAELFLEAVEMLRAHEVTFIGA